MKTNKLLVIWKNVNYDFINRQTVNEMIFNIFFNFNKEISNKNKIMKFTENDKFNLI